MSLFDWRDHDNLDEVDRYPVRAGDFPVRGRVAWIKLWETLLGLSRSGADERDDYTVWDEAFQDFLEEANRDPRPPVSQRPCCVFVSHRRIDVNYAERIAYLAAQHGLQYW